MFTKLERALVGRGVFDRACALAAGATAKQIRGRLRTGEWAEVLPGVYSHSAARIDGALMRQAAVLWAGKGAALSHSSAAAVWQLDSVQEKLTVTVPARRNPRSPLVTVHRTDLAANEITTVNGLPCTSLARTILDLAGEVTESLLESAIESARRRHGASISAFAAQLDHGANSRRSGTTALRSVLESLDPRAACESVFEVKVARLLRASLLPPPVRQFWIQVGGRRYRLDFAWPEWRVALECDGRAFHDFQRDRTRWRELGSSGWRVLPVTWRDTTDRWDVVVRDLGAALAA
jgi:very-short-patch-repair endonuclease